MSRLRKELSLYERDEEGKLIPQEVKLELANLDAENNPDLKDMTIMITPMPRGEIKRLFNMAGKVDDIKPDTTKDEDGELIMSHCFDPLFTLEDLPFITPVIARSIVSTIFRESGIKFASGEKKIDDDDEFGKNSNELNEKKVRGV